jgi:phospholipase/carboxylesterase
LKRITTRAGELDVHVLEPEAGAPADVGQAPRLVVLAHGFGAPGTDLVPLARELVALEPRLASARFAFPVGPIDLAPLGMWGGRAWFPIDLEALDMANRSGRSDVLAAAEPPGLALARKKLRVAVQALMAPMGIGWSEVVLGGFSQGAMTTLDLALKLEEAPRAVVLFSPTLVDAEGTRRAAKTRDGLPVFVSHGRQDPLLPFAATERLVALLVEAGVRAELMAFDGPHTIPFEALRGAARAMVRG